jgi:hypothetical protein
VQTIEDATQVFYRFQQQSIVQGMNVTVRVAPGVGHSFAVTVLKSTTGAVGSGVPTAMTVTLVDTTTTNSNYIVSVDFEQGEYLALQVSSSSPGAAQDLMVEVDLF